MEQFLEQNPNPVISVEKDGTVLYSNEAGESLLQEWGVKVRRKTAFEYDRHCAKGNYPE